VAGYHRVVRVHREGHGEDEHQDQEEAQHQEVLFVTGHRQSVFSRNRRMEAARKFAVNSTVKTRHGIPGTSRSNDTQSQMHIWGRGFILKCAG